MASSSDVNQNTKAQNRKRDKSYIL